MCQKICIWCSKSEKDTPFKKDAHIVPQSLGGEELCEFVCDSCNHYFGNRKRTIQSIELVIKETFALSRAMLLKNSKLKSNKRYTSTFFKINWEKHNINVKYAYKILPHFQKNMAVLITKGMYKMLLEKLAKENYEEVLSNRFDFIREYCRYDLETINRVPLIYFYRQLEVVAHSADWTKSPKFIIHEIDQGGYLFRNKNFLEIEFLGHVFGLVMTKNWKLHFSDYIYASQNCKHNFFKGYKFVERWNDIDIPLCMFDDKVYKDFIKSKNIIHFK